MIFASFLDRENFSRINTSNKKKINIPISNLSSEEIYALLDNIDRDYEEEINNLMNDYDTEFLDRTIIENLEREISEAVIRQKDDSNGSNFIPTTKPIESVAKIPKPNSESQHDGDDIPLISKKRCRLEME